MNETRWQYRIAPLLLLLLGIFVFNSLRGALPAEEANDGVETAVPTPLSTNTRPPILQAEILPSATPTLTPRPQHPENININLFGPPANSNLSPNSPVTFYWEYPIRVQSGQQLVVTLEQNGTEYLLGNLIEPNFGSNYQLKVDMRELDIVTGTAVWQVRLEWIEEHEPIINSERRSISFMSN